jgi:hypothetical protein
MGEGSMSVMRPWLKAVAVLVGLGAAGPAWGQDIVVYWDRGAKKEEELRGSVEAEGPAGIKVRGRGGVRSIPAGDVRRVLYRVADVPALAFRQPFAVEERARKEERPRQRGELLQNAEEAFRKLEQDVKGSPQAQRYIQYKVAEVLALQARDEPKRAEEAIRALGAFVKEHKDGWQIQGALKLLGKLQEEAGNVDEARKAYEELAAVPGVPPGTKRESEVLVARLLLRGEKYPEAEKKLSALEKELGEGDPLKPYVLAYLADSRMGQGKLKGVEGQLKGAARAGGDNKLRALGSNLLGDYYRRRGKPEEAFWQYLRVDALYPDDAEEHAKALYYLRGLFDKVKRDPVRARECAGRLAEKRFAGTAYQKKAAAEKK